VILYPAIDLREGRCVRLVQGDFDRETSYGDDPISVARLFVASGAQWLHVVDLDAARGPVGDGKGSDNRDLIEALAAIVPIPIQVGGGVRDATLLERGVARVVVGSLAVSDPDAVRRLAKEYPGRVAVGLDHRDGEVRVRGWADGSAITVPDALAAVDCPELGAVVVTEIGRDGMLSGPDLDGLAEVLALTDTPVIASGGVSSVVDLRALAGLRSGGLPGGGRRLAGTIVGKAIYEGKVDLIDALRVVGAWPTPEATNRARA
jgi:phosphoribosylformimino-5-aminoimidazole carboxamide ribotide isomerase